MYLSLICLLISGLVNIGLGFHCHSDIDYNNVTQISESLTPKPDNRTYWGAQNFHMMYYVYGTFGKDPRNANIVAGLFIGEDNAHFIVKIYCNNKSWKLYVNDNGSLTQWRTGIFKKDCTPGIWDLTLKVEQRYMAYFLFNNEPMDNKLSKKYRHREKVATSSTQVLRLPMDVTKADHFKVTVVGAAALTRFAYGKCYTFPHELKWNCQAASDYVIERAKKTEGLQLGIQTQQNRPVCYNENTRYWHWQQSKVHVDENSNGNQYCCCTNMTTGELVVDREVTILWNKLSPDYYKDYLIQYLTCAPKQNEEASCHHFLCQSAMDINILIMHNDTESLKLVA